MVTQKTDLFTILTLIFHIFLFRAGNQTEALHLLNFKLLEKVRATIWEDDQEAATKVFHETLLDKNIKVEVKVISFLFILIF